MKRPVPPSTQFCDVFHALHEVLSHLRCEWFRSHSRTRRSAMLMRALIGTLTSGGKKRMQRNASGENLKLSKWPRIDNHSARIRYLRYYFEKLPRNGEENSIISNGSRKNINCFNRRDARKFPKLCQRNDNPNENNE